MSKVIFRMLIGALAALLAWTIFEPTRPADSPIANPDGWNAFETHLILAWGGFIGLAVGGYNGYLQGSRTKLLAGLGLGGLLGCIGAGFGYHLGDSLVRMVFGQSLDAIMVAVASGRSNSALLILARTLALTPLGTFIGGAIGVGTLDKRRIVHGLIGGTIGGAMGGLLFDTIGSIAAIPSLAAQGVQQGEVGQIPRAAYSLVMGALIGLFIGLAEQIARQAWVRQALGKNEGREWPIFAARNMIGRNELAQIPIFGDPAVAAVHAFIDRQGHDYWLADAGSGTPTFLDGQPVTTAPLINGAHIQIGNTVLQFLLKGSAKAPLSYAMPIGGIPGPGQPIPMPMPGYPMPMQPTPGYQPMPMQSIPSQPTTVVATPSYAPTLVATDGPMAGQRFPITNFLEIGRENAGLTLGFDTSVSRRHASITPSPTGLILQDLGSTNGSFLNGQRVTSATLNPGDLVRIGATTFRVE